MEAKPNSTVRNILQSAQDAVCAANQLRLEEMLGLPVIVRGDDEILLASPVYRSPVVAIGRRDVYAPDRVLYVNVQNGEWRVERIAGDPDDQPVATVTPKNAPAATIHQMQRLFNEFYAALDTIADAYTAGSPLPANESRTLTELYVLLADPGVVDIDRALAPEFFDALQTASGQKA